MNRITGAILLTECISELELNVGATENPPTASQYRSQYKTFVLAICHLLAESPMSILGRLNRTPHFEIWGESRSRNGNLIEISPRTFQFDFYTHHRPILHRFGTMHICPGRTNEQITGVTTVVTLC